MSNTLPTIIAYHANCIDGFTAAWAIARKLPPAVEYKLFPMEYTQDSYDSLVKFANSVFECDIYIVDFSVPLNTIAQLNACSNVNQVTILDHHKTAFQNYGYGKEITAESTMSLHLGKTHIHLDNSRSGAAIAYQWMEAEMDDSEDGLAKDYELPALVKYVQDYDLWKFEFGEDTKAVNAYLKLHAPNIANWNEIAELLEDSVGTAAVLYEGEKLLEQFEAECLAYASKAVPIIINRVAGAMTCTPHQYASRVGELIALQTKTFGATYRELPSGKFGVSLRTRKSECFFRGHPIDVSELAKHYLGGGHAEAAGFEISGDLLFNAKCEI